MANNTDYRLKTIKCLFKIAGVQGLVDYLLSKITKNWITTKLHAVYPSAIDKPVLIRVPSSDVLTYWQVFIDKEYDMVINRAPSVIIDAGANIGLASIYFTTRFPAAQIIAIEPEDSNFEMLQKNVSQYPNVMPIHAALWNENKKIELVDPGLGNSGYMTLDKESKKFGMPKQLVEAMTVDRIMDQFNIKHIDILKIDVEGAEMEIFDNPARWITCVDSMIVELHERMRPGCSINFNRAAMDFTHKWANGENVCAARHDGCLAAEGSLVESQVTVR